MRLYFVGSRDEFEQALHIDDYTEWSIDFGRDVLLRADRPASLAQAVVALEIPRRLVHAYARGRAAPGEYLVPSGVITDHDRGTM